MSFNVKVISTLNDKNAHEFSMFCDLCVTRLVRFRLKSFSSCIKFWKFFPRKMQKIILQVTNPCRRQSRKVGEGIHPSINWKATRCYLGGICLSGFWLGGTCLSGGEITVRDGRGKISLSNQCDYS